MTFVCPRFLRLTSLCSVCLSRCRAKTFCLRPRGRLCETVNPHVISSGMENSLICQQQSVLSPLKRKCFLIEVAGLQTTPNRADMLMHYCFFFKLPNTLTWTLQGISAIWT